jgi:hypothetical protein
LSGKDESERQQQQPQTPQPQKEPTHPQHRRIIGHPQEELANIQAFALLGNVSQNTMSTSTSDLNAQ